MAEARTRPTGASVDAFLRAVEDDERRADSLVLVRLMKRLTRAQPSMWGPSIVGFGVYHYVYASGREGDWPLTGFSPRKRELVVYVMAGFDRYPRLMRRLGRFRTGTSCLYIRRLEDVDMAALKELIAASVEHMKRAHRPAARRSGSRASSEPRSRTARASSPPARRRRGSNSEARLIRTGPSPRKKGPPS